MYVLCVNHDHQHNGAQSIPYMHADPQSRIASPCLPSLGSCLGDRADVIPRCLRAHTHRSGAPGPPPGLGYWPTGSIEQRDGLLICRSPPSARRTTMSAPTPAPTRPVLEHLNSAATPATAPSDVPSVFETLASDELRDLIQPAFRYVLAVRPFPLLAWYAVIDLVLKFFAQRYPRYLLRLINSHEEVYAGFLAAIEAFHLHAYGTSLGSLPSRQAHVPADSTFTDHFYGLEFRSLTPNPLPPSKLAPDAIPTTSRLSRRQKLSALACIVRSSSSVLPFLAWTHLTGLHRLESHTSGPKRRICTNVSAPSTQTPIRIIPSAYALSSPITRPILNGPAR